MDGVERADADGVDEICPGGDPAKGKGDHVDAIVYGGVEARHDVRVVEDVTLADLVSRDPGAGGAALGGPVHDAEEADVGDEAAAGSGKRVRSVAFEVAGAIDLVARMAVRVEVPRSDQLPVQPSFSQS